MKIRRQIFLLPLALLIFSLSSFAQKKAISGQEYESLESAARAKVEKITRKITAVNNDFRNGRLTKSRTTTQEFLPPDKSKWLVLEGSGFRVSNKTELIYIGDLEYRKENDGDWVKRDLRSDEGGGLVALNAKPSHVKMEYFLEEETIDKEIYKVLTKTTFNEPAKIFTEHRIWINKEGLIYKITGSMEIKTSNMLLSTATTYEYNIAPPKIEAPVK